MPDRQHLAVLIDVSDDGRAIATIRLAGEIDVMAAETCRAELEQLTAQARQIILDLSKVTFCDAAGAGFLLTIVRQAKAAGVPVIVRNLSRPVRRTLQLTGTLSIICPEKRGATLASPKDHSSSPGMPGGHNHQ